VPWAAATSDAEGSSPAGVQTNDVLSPVNTRVPKRSASSMLGIADAGHFTL
jgi:hypothetical protein